jgi:hypothetical protein
MTPVGGKSTPQQFQSIAPGAIDASMMSWMAASWSSSTASAAVGGGVPALPAPAEVPEAATATAVATITVINVRCWEVFTWFSWGSTHHVARDDGWLGGCLGLEVDAGTC